MKKNIFKISALLAAAAMLFAGCQPDELSTDQFAGAGSDIVLSAFGPNPIYRGGTLTIVGANLEKVTEVIIPGVEPLTEITVEAKGTPSKISVVVPVEGPEVGPISIKGGGKTVSSEVDLTYTEPIVFTSFSPASAMPGDEITITGDYLNLIQEVVFGGGAISDSITVQTRHELKVVVPETAVSGIINLGDANQLADPDAFANLYPSAAELAIGAPTVSGNAATLYKAGKPLTVSGTYLCMIKSVEFQNASVTEFEVSDDWKTITLTIPAAAKDGAVKAVSYGGAELAAGSVTLVKPTELAAAPQPVKAGAELTVSGADLDLVTGLAFAGAGAADFTLSDGKIKATVPAKATEGNATLSLANGETFDVAYTLVHPTVTAVAPTDIMAGDTITVSGTDLDLITKVTLGGKEESFELKDDKIAIATANTSVAGKIVLTLANGETVEPGENITVGYDSFIVVNQMPAAEHIGATVVLKGSNFMMVDRIYIGEAKVTQYVMRTDDEVRFIMPYNKIGTYPVKFELMNGDVEVCPTQIEVLLEQQFITGWEGELEITWNDGGRVMVPAEKFAGVKAGTVLRFYYTQKDQVWAQAQVNYGDWSGINFNADGGTKFDGTLVPTDVYGWFSDGILDRCTEVVLTDEILANLQAKKGGCEGVDDLAIIIQGQDLIFTKVEIVCEIPQEITIWEGTSNHTGGYDNNIELGGEDDWVNAGLYEGAEVRIYFTPDDPADWSVQVFDGHWNSMSYVTPNNEQWNVKNTPDATDKGYVSFIATGDAFTALTTKAYWGSAIILQGKNLVFTKIAFI